VLWQVANGLDYLLKCANASRKARTAHSLYSLRRGSHAGAFKINPPRNWTERTFQSLVLLNRNTVKEIMNITDAAFRQLQRMCPSWKRFAQQIFDALASGKLIITILEMIKEKLKKREVRYFARTRSIPTDFVKKIELFVQDNGKLLIFRQMHASWPRKIRSEEIIGSVCRHLRKAELEVLNRLALLSLHNIFMKKYFSTTVSITTSGQTNVCLLVWKGKTSPTKKSFRLWGT